MKSNHLFLGSLIAGAAAVAVATAVFGMAAVQWILVSMFSIAFLPFLIALGAAALLSVVLILGIVVAMFTGESGADLILDSEVDGASAEGAADLASGYYELLFSIKHPIPWGLALGLTLTSSAIFGVHWWTVVRPLAQTSEELAQIRRDLSNAKSELIVQNNQVFSKGSPLVDAFGRPYVVKTSGLTKTYEVRSLGADVDDPSDDLCVMAGSTAARVSKAALDLLSGKTPSKSAAYSAIFELKCPE